MDALIDHDRFGGSTDPVVLELLAGIIRAARPRTMLQLGTWIGYSTLFIADIISPGQLFTVDPDLDAHEIARSAVRDAQLENVTFLDGYSTDPQIIGYLRGSGSFSLVYVDSSHSYRGTLAELAMLFEDGILSEDGLVMFHDAAESAAEFDPTAEGGVPAALNRWSDRLEITVFQRPLFPTECGLALVRFRK